MKKCNTCKFCEVIPFYHVYGTTANCEHPESNLDPETSKVEDLEKCLYYEHE